jgi:uncharacterized protein YdhG (YjbR/CyaY superfamily)
METATAYTIEPNKMFELAEMLKEEKAYKDQLKETLSETNESIKQYEEELATLMIEAEMPRFTKNGTTFFLTTDIRCSATPGNQEALFETLREHDAGDLVKETVNANSLKAWVREMMADNEGELPEFLEGKVNIFERSICGTRKGGK